jgi:hypothetical protein
MRALSNIIVPILMMVLAGCRTMPTLSPKEAYFHKHPEQQRYYLEFWETSPDAVADAENEKLTAMIVLIHNVQNQYTNYPDLMQGMDVVEKRIQGFRDKPFPLVVEINKVFDPKTDTLFWYCQEDGEKGHMLVRDGDCYRKFIAEGPIKVGKP